MKVQSYEGGLRRIGYLCFVCGCREQDHCLLAGTEELANPLEDMIGFRRPENVNFYELCLFLWFGQL